MSKSKKPSASGAKYKVGQKVFIISYHRDIPENLLEGKVVSVLTNESLVRPAFTETSYEYVVIAIGGSFTEIEERVYANYPAAAQVFAKAFLKSLK